MTDDFISTDIDKIITILKKRGKISLNDLAREANTSASLLEKWLPILEEEGLIDISYHLTRVYISWTGEGTVDTSSKVIPKSEYPIDISPEQYEYPVHRDIELPDDETIKIKEQSDLKKLPSSVNIKQKQVIKNEEPIGKFELPKEIKKEFDTSESKVTSRSEAIKKLHPDIRLPKEVSSISLEKSPAREIKIKPLAFDVEEPRKTKLDARAQKIKEYMEDINKARDDLERLKIEKRKLFRETYEPIEKKFAAELETISDKISEKEERILQLQQKVLLLPGVIEEVDRQQLKLREIEQEARKTFDDASIAINESLADLAELEKQATEQISVAKENINLGIDESEEINSVLTRIGVLEIEVRDKLNSAKKRMEEEQSRVNSLEKSIEKIENIREKAVHKVEEVVFSVESQKQRIMDLQKEVQKIGEIQNWVSKHKEEYGSLIDEFGEQIKDNELEYNKLREAIETNFVRRYVEDLDEVSKGYEFELGKAKEAEENIDTKIELTKQRISDLLRKSREIVEIFESSEKEAPIEINIETLQNRESQVLTKMQNKETERHQILETLKEISDETYHKPLVSKEEKQLIQEKTKEKKLKKKIQTYSEFLSEKRSEGLDMKQISRAWKKYKKENGI